MPFVTRTSDLSVPRPRNTYSTLLKSSCWYMPTGVPTYQGIDLGTVGIF